MFFRPLWRNNFFCPGNFCVIHIRHDNFRRNCIDEDVFAILKDQTAKVLEMNGACLEEINYEPDHVHILLSAPPQASLAKLINSIKTTTSRRIRKETPKYISEFYWKPLFWSKSYMILSSGGAPIEVIKQYIQEQGTEEHFTRKKRKAA
ncbi:MAG: IS200/IS605 family transposase [Solobacterium sp.]|nr:IS200/IS605 family transposase [Solobacterium sp.]